MNPKKIGGLANHKQEPWKAPLPDFIEDLYFKRFGKNNPTTSAPSNRSSWKKRTSEQKAKPERQRERKALLWLSHLSKVISDCRMGTATRFYNKAQRRIAHPGFILLYQIEKDLSIILEFRLQRVSGSQNTLKRELQR